MRSLSYVAVGVAVLASLACGNASVESGNSYVTEQPLEVAEVGSDAFIVVPVSSDEDDKGCSIDGLRFSSCAVSRDPAPAFVGATDFCELQVGGPSRYFVECGLNGSFEKTLEPLEELPAHCPEH